MYYILLLLGVVLFLISVFILTKSGSNRKFKGYWEFWPCVISKVSLFMLLAGWGLCVIFDDDNIFRSTKHQSRIYCFDESNPLCVGNVMLVSDNAVYLMVFFSLVLIYLGFFVLSDSLVEIRKDKVVKKWSLLGFSYKKEINFENLEMSYRGNNIKYGLKIKDNSKSFSFFYVCFPYKIKDIIMIERLILKALKPNSS